MITPPPITQYLFESSICLTAFYLLYYLLFRKDTFFQFNRFYLLVSAVTSLLIPVLQIRIAPNKVDQQLVMDQFIPILHTYNEQYASVMNSVEEPLLWAISVGDLISVIYKLGAFLFGLKLLSGLFKIFDLIKASKATYRPEYTILKPKDETYLASSFFSYIFWNDKKDSKSKIIIEHELVHVKQWHSIDVILMELMVVVKWFNPLIYLFRNSLRRTHEYIADKYVCQQMGSKYAYAQFIVNENRNDKSNLSNSMFSFIKERLIMLNHKQTSKLGFVKYLMIFPVFISLLTLFSFDMSNNLPKEIINPIKSVEDKLIGFSNSNLIEFNNYTKDSWNKQFIWGDGIRISLDENVFRQNIVINLRRGGVKKFLDQLPEITNHQGEIVFYPMYHKSDKNTHDDLVYDLVNPTNQEELLTNLNYEDELNFISEFIYNDKIYKQEVKIRITAFLFSMNIDNSKRNFKWGNIEVNYDKELKDKVVTRFNIRDAVFLNEDGVDLADYSRLLPFTSTPWPVFDITKKEYKEHLSKKMMVFTKDNESKPIKADQVVEIRLMRKFMKQLKSLDLASINEYKESINLPDGVEFYPQAGPNGNHEIIQYLKTTTSQLRNSKKIRDWLLLASNGDAIEFNFMGDSKENRDDNFGLMFLIEDPNKVEYPKKIDEPLMTKEYADFQIVINRGGKSFVRLDTALIKNRKIIDSYKNSESYDIVHIPNFKTKMRVVDKQTEASDVKVMTEMKHGTREINPLKLLEFYPDNDTDMRLSWGAMLSMKSVGNFSYKEFERSYNNEFVLFYGDEKLPILKYEILIPKGSDLYHRIQTDSNNYYKILELLSNVEKISTIYVDNIILEKDGQNWLLPHQFSYSFE